MPWLQCISLLLSLYLLLLTYFFTNFTLVKFLKCHYRIFKNSWDVSHLCPYPWSALCRQCKLVSARGLRKQISAAFAPFSSGRTLLILLVLGLKYDTNNDDVVVRTWSADQWPAAEPPQGSGRVTYEPRLLQRSAADVYWWRCHWWRYLRSPEVAQLKLSSVCGRPDRPQYESCPSICLVKAPTFKTKGRRKTSI